MYSVNETLKAGETSTIHKFELRGLGKAPFRFVCMSEKFYQAFPGAPSQPGSSCDYCGMCIGYEFWCRSADGNQFKVGSDCIHKVDDAGLVKQISAAERQLRDKRNSRARELKIARENKRIAAAKENLESVKSVLAAVPHPYKHHADNGLTLLHYVQWLLVNGGRSGLLQAAVYVERAAKGESVK